MMNKEGTTLFRHEIAYVLGQLQARSAVPSLLSVLRDTEDDPIVRHEVSDQLQVVDATVPASTSSIGGPHVTCVSALAVSVTPVFMSTSVRCRLPRPWVQSLTRRRWKHWTPFATTSGQR